MCCRPRRHGNLEFPWNLGLFLEKGWKHVYSGLEKQVQRTHTSLGVEALVWKVFPNIFLVHNNSTIDISRSIMTEDRGHIILSPVSLAVCHKLFHIIHYYSYYICYNFIYVYPLRVCL